MIMIIMIIDRQAQQLCNRRYEGDHFPVSTAFCSTPKGKCGLIPSHFHQLRNVIVAAVIQLAYNIVASCRLCAGGR